MDGWFGKAAGSIERCRIGRLPASTRRSAPGRALESSNFHQRRVPPKKGKGSYRRANRTGGPL